MDDMLRDRAQKSKARRDAVWMEIAVSRRQQEMPVPMLTACQLDAFICALRTRVLDREEGFSKRYGRKFVSEIRCDAKRIAMQKKAPLISAAVKKKGHHGGAQLCT